MCALLTSCGAADDVWPVLVDLDPLGGGIDVVLGAEGIEGARWSGLHSAGDRLDPEQLVEGLPRWWDVPFLACDLPAPPNPAAVASVLESARAIGPVIVDVGRWPSPARAETIKVATAVVLVVPARVPAVAAAAGQRAAVESSPGFAGTSLLVVRDDGAALSASRVAAAVQLELAGTIGADPGLAAGRDRGVDVRRIRRSHRSLARQLLDRCREPTPTLSRHRSVAAGHRRSA